MSASAGNWKIAVENLDVFYGTRQVLKNVNVEAAEKSLTCIVGPSGCGKSTFLMAINRLIDEIPGAKAKGKIRVKLNDSHPMDVLKLGDDRLPQLRRRIGLVFQNPNVLPMSVFNNVAFPLKIMRARKKEIEEKVENALKKVSLWEEVRSRLNYPARELSGGQQQRLCLARVLAMGPEILLLDEPTSFLDERLAIKIESLLMELKKEITIVMVSHYLSQVNRLADRVYRLG